MRLETEDDIQRLIDDRIPENYILEYKKEPWPEKKGKNTASEIAKDISSFANTQGGQIIVGVEEDKKTKEPIARHPFKISNWEERIEDIRHNAIKPYIEGLRIYRIKSDEQENKAYLIVEIPESPNAPHMVTTSNKYYRRDNSGAKPMSEAEVRELYNRRIAQEKRLEELYAPSFEKLKQGGTNIKATSTQWFLLFLPRVFQNARVEIYKESLLEHLKHLVQDSEVLRSYGLHTFPIEEFIHLRNFDVPRSDYYRYANIWIHTSGGILITSNSFSSERIGRKIPLGILVNFIEAAFKFISSFSFKYLGNLEFKTKLVLKNVGDWNIPNFLNYYDENFRTWLKGSPWFPFLEDEPRGGKPDITVECYVHPWQLKEDNLRQFLKKEIFLPTLRAFGHPILDE